MILTLLKPARNVVQLYGLCTNAWDGRLRLVLELCDHGNVRDYIKALPRDKVIRYARNGVHCTRCDIRSGASFCCCMRSQLGAAFVLDVMVQLALGVAHLHSCGILHRDLKADNALIQGLDPLVVKWGDYGCAVQLGVNLYGDGRHRS